LLCVQKKKRTIYVIRNSKNKQSNYINYWKPKFLRYENMSLLQKTTLIQIYGSHNVSPWHISHSVSVPGQSSFWYDDDSSVCAAVAASKWALFFGLISERPKLINLRRSDDELHHELLDEELELELELDDELEPEW